MMLAEVMEVTADARSTLRRCRTEVPEAQAASPSGRWVLHPLAGPESGFWSAGVSGLAGREPNGGPHMSESSVPRRISLALAVAALALLGLAGNASAATLATFGFTGSAQTFTVPAGVHHVSIQALGAQGGPGGVGEFDMQGGLGGQANAPLSVTPGEVLFIYVGGSGGYGGAPSGGGIINAGPGGFNGGGAGGQANTACDGDTCENGYGAGGGGGATDVRQGGSGLGNRVIVAGGGAGGAADCTDGGGGGGT